ncbi:hypothetical protein H8F21_14790 [Pseudomonas sp. P66]|uniref:Uncharacterized protein n=1 Tax=Pseudomonas arcuscaelestis TaxID=2710591 RepID=A0ABS2BYY6_9PSED|nr:hypothetical protein [Pseudomonas arcuscaelestis]MBM5458833.1 hypothetical protein [Pseudomonas arcuscaelestis]
MIDAHNEPQPLGSTVQFTGDHSSCALNPFAGFNHESGDLLELVEAATGFDLTPAQRTAAVNSGLQVAQQGEPSVATLAAAWAQQPELVDFANAVRRAFLPD